MRLRRKPAANSSHLQNFSERELNISAVFLNSAFKFEIRLFYSKWTEKLISFALLCAKKTPADTGVCL